ncbi:MAG: type II/IV secretion system protein [Alphaproteobacteria bacterium]|nr:MAG: type II/IV secretion system protein [Alphaproteobacteria bacterium]
MVFCSSSATKLDINEVFVDDSLLRLFPEKFCIRHNLIPISFENEILTIATEEENHYVTDELYSLLKFTKIVFKIFPKNSIRNHIKRFFEKHNFDIKSNQYNESIGEYLCDKILLEAFKKNASDIHFCPDKEKVFVKYRIDGTLKEEFEFEKRKWSYVCVRIKVLAELDIAETRVPQDGSFSRKMNNKKVDFRVSCHPTVFGENMVLRILGNSKPIGLLSLNYAEEILDSLKQFVNMPEGLFIFTGPVGSGKTTSLYSLLSCFDPHQNNIVTLEDPVECYLPFIRQTDINKSPNMNFSNGIKSLLRQDPNIMLIGEVRDLETANMVMRAAMTGHKVFTTMHTSNAIGVFNRLIEFKIDKSLIFQYLKGVVSQRLVRKLCDCKELTDDVSEDLSKLIGQSVMFKAIGCQECHYSGFKGRVLIAECLLLKQKANNLIVGSQFLDFIPDDFKTMEMFAIELIKNGTTTYEEVSRYLYLS